MHKIEIPQEVIGRIVERRGKLHIFDAVDVARTAQIVVDLQNGFMAPGQPAEIAGARDIVPNVNRISETLRRLGGVNIFIQNTIDDESRKSWSNWFGYFVGEERQRRMDIAFEKGSYGHALWSGLEIAETDLKVLKRRFSAFTPGTSELHNVLQARGVDTLIITGTATNVCCESTARDAQMLNYKVIFVSDGCATYTDAVHNATLCSMMTNFADVMTTDEVAALLHKSSVTTLARSA
jgi:ureidoacrylate peracid hydrolase